LCEVSHNQADVSLDFVAHLTTAELWVQGEGSCIEGRVERAPSIIENAIYLHNTRDYQFRKSK
jgi:hypothetical protein